MSEAEKTPAIQGDNAQASIASDPFDPLERESVVDAADQPTEQADRRETLVHASEGQRLLLAVTDSSRAAASKLGVGVASVLRWRSGEDKPRGEARAALQSVYKIPAGSWDLVAAVDAAATPSTALAPVDTASGTTTLAEVLALLARIRKAYDTKDLAPSELNKLIAAETRALSVRHRLEHAAELLEDRIVTQHPTWHRIRRALVDALAPYPEAARAVVKALGELELRG